jgi:hypothetical protein
MLATGHEHDLISSSWNTCDRKAKLPAELALRFFQPHGATPLHYDSQRSFHRYFLRGKAVLTRGDERLGSFTKDVSRQGVGFLSPVQLMPLERVKLRFPSAELTLEVARCRRVADGCFECGAKFVL